jgi:hypothetical protein
MSDELRPGVAELLHAKHGVSPDVHRAGVAVGDSQDRDQMIQIASGVNHPEYRIKAMNVLAADPEAAEVFRGALDDRAADDTVRAAGATLLARSGADSAEDALVTALTDEPSNAVRHKIVAGLARVGGEAAHRALADPAAQDDGLGEHARFARTLIAYRLGAATDPIVIDPGQRAPGQHDSAAVWYPAIASLAADVIAQIAPDSYGVPLDQASISTVDCDGQRWAIAVSSVLTAGQPDGPTIAGLVALQSPADESFSTSMVILWRPDPSGLAGISVHRLDGRPVYVGEGETDGQTTEFVLDAVRQPGAVEKTIEGQLREGRLVALRIRSGQSLPSRHPVAIR